MRIRTLAIAVAILAVLSAAVYIADRPPAPPAPDGRVGKPLAEDTIFNGLARVRVTDSGKTLELVRQPDNTWVVPSYFALPVDIPRLGRLIDYFTEVRVERVVSSNPSRIALLGFEQTSVVLLDAGGRELLNVEFGKETQAGGRFLRFGKEPKAYLAEAGLYFDTEPKSWVDPVLTNITPDEVAKIELTFFRDGVRQADALRETANSATMSRAKKEDPFTVAGAPAGRTLKVSAVQNTVGALGNLRMIAAFAPDHSEVTSAGPVLRRAQLTTFSGRVLTVDVSQKPKTPPDPDKPLEVDDPSKNPPAIAKLTDSGTGARLTAEQQKLAYGVDEFVVGAVPGSWEDLFE